MISRAMLDQLRELLRPIRTNVSNIVARAVISVVNDKTKMQSVQIGVQEGQDLEGAERFQEYGFSSNPLPGAEAVVVCPMGDTGIPLVIATDDRRYRPKDGDPADVNVYHKDGARITLKANGDIQIDCKAGQKVLVSDGTGGESPVALLSDVKNVRDDLDGHEHLYISPLHPAVGPPIKTTAGPSVTNPVGAVVLETK